MPNVNQIIIGVVVIALVGGGIFLFTTGRITPTEESKEQTLAAEIFSLAGQVVSVNTGSNSFVMTDQQSGQDFTVTIGEETEFISLEFPFDLGAPPEDLETFVPERKDTTIQALRAGDFVFVRSSHEIKSREEVVNPLEIQILP